MPRRNTRFYRRNESKVMEQLGFRPTPNSGSGWIHKEDGESDTALCQLKSTDAQSISINQNDLHVLEKHASISHKTPVFAIQFLNTGEVWILTRPEDVTINQGKIENIFEDCEKTVDKKTNVCYSKDNLNNDIKVKQAREAYNNEMNEQREKRNKERRKNMWKKNSIKQG